MDYFKECIIVIMMIIFIICIYFHQLRKLYYLNKFFKNFPTPPTGLILGNAREFSSTLTFLATLHKYTKEHGSMVHIKLGPVGHLLLCSDYDFLEFLFSNNQLLKRPDDLKLLKPWLGNGLVVVNGEMWKAHRRLLTPSFSYNLLEKFVNIFESTSNILVEKLSNIGDSDNFDIYPYMTRCIFDIVCESIMGVGLDVQNTETSHYFQSVKNICKIFMTRVTSVVKCYDFIHRFTKDYATEQDALKCLHDFTESVINKRRKQRKTTRGSTNSGGIREKKVFLDLILESADTLSYAEIKDEVNTLLFGGHDTTSAATSFILFCLSNHKEVQNKILEEQREIFGNVSNPDVTFTSLQKMKYLDNVIKEGLRLYSPVPIFAREFDQEIQYNGMAIPKGVRIIVFAQGLHMNPKFYPDPEKFDPSRFENSEKKPFAFIPFGAGLRNCIGQKFAMMLMKSVISKIVRNFELSPAFPTHHMELVLETVLKSASGVKIGLKLRQNI